MSRLNPIVPDPLYVSDLSADEFEFLQLIRSLTNEQLHRFVCLLEEQGALLQAGYVQ